MTPEGTMSERLQQTLDLYDFGVSMMAARLRREHPGESAEQLERRLDEWLTQREPLEVEAPLAPDR